MGTTAILKIQRSQQQSINTKLSQADSEKGKLKMSLFIQCDTSSGEVLLFTHPQQNKAFCQGRSLSARAAIALANSTNWQQKGTSHKNSTKAFNLETRGDNTNTAVNHHPAFHLKNYTAQHHSIVWTPGHNVCITVGTQCLFNFYSFSKKRMCWLVSGK